MVATYHVGDGPFSATGSTRFGGVGRRFATFLRFFDTGMGVKASVQKPILSNAGRRPRLRIQMNDTDIAVDGDVDRPSDSGDTLGIRLLHNAGWTFIYLGVLTLGFVVHQLFITTWFAQQAQSELAGERRTYRLLVNCRADGIRLGGRLLEAGVGAVELGLRGVLIGQQFPGSLAREAGQCHGRLGGAQLRGLRGGIQPDQNGAGIHVVA